MSAIIAINRGFSPLEALGGLSLCLNAPGVRAVARTGGGYAGSTALALLEGGPFTPTSPLLGNNGDALLHKAISTEEMFQRDPTVPDRLGPVDPFALAQVLEDLTRIGDLFFSAARLETRIQMKSWEMIEPT